MTVTDLPGPAPAPLPQGRPVSSPTAAPGWGGRPLRPALDAGHRCLVLGEGQRQPGDAVPGSLVTFPPPSAAAVLEAGAGFPGVV